MTTLDAGGEHPAPAAGTPPPVEAGPVRSATQRRRGLRVHPGWIVVVGACAMLVRSTIRQGLNTDVFWHLAAGNWMLAHHAVIRTDLYSYTIHGHAWLAEEWGFEVVLAFMVHHVGPYSYWILSGGACVLAFVVSVLRWRRQGAGVLWVALLSIFLAASLVLGIAPRPQDVSYFFFALELYLLTVARSRRAVLLLFPPLFLLWTNMHGSFIAGLGILALELAAAALATLLARRTPSTNPLRLHLAPTLKVRDALATFFASFAVSLVNPHGPRLLLYAFNVATTSRLDVIEEWQSPNFHVPMMFLAIAIPTMLIVAALSTGRLPVDAVALVIWLALFAATLHGVRFMPYLGIAFGGLAAPWGRAFKETIRPMLVTVPVALVAAVALIAGPHTTAGALDKSTAPKAAATWLRAHPGRVFSSYVYNDYLILRGIPVFVDGRTDLYFGTGVLSSYLAISSLSKPPDPVLAHWHVRYVLWPTKSAFSNYLAVDPHWRRVKKFGDSEIFVRVSA